MGISSSIFSERLSELLEEYKKEHGFTQNEIADKLGISSGAFSNYVSDLAEIKIENIYKIANYFKVSSDYLLGLVNVRSPKVTLRTICQTTKLTQKNIEKIISSLEEDIYALSLLINDKLFEKLGDSMFYVYEFVSQQKYNIKEFLDSINAEKLDNYKYAKEIIQKYYDIKHENEEIKLKLNGCLYDLSLTYNEFIKNFDKDVKDELVNYENRFINLYTKIQYVEEDYFQEIQEQHVKNIKKSKRNYLR